MSDFKLPISKNANDALGRMVKAVNQDFKEGKVSRGELLSWIVLKFEEQKFERQIALIRKEHFDPLKALLSLTFELTKAKRSGQKIENLDRLQSLLTELK